MPSKKSKKRLAAFKREAEKGGRVNPYPAITHTRDPTLTNDPDFEPDSSPSEAEEEQTGREDGPDQTKTRGIGPIRRMATIPVLPARSRASEYRNRKGLTKKAQAFIAHDGGIHKFFRVATSTTQPAQIQSGSGPGPGMLAVPDVTELEAMAVSRHEGLQQEICEVRVSHGETDGPDFEMAVDEDEAHFQFPFPALPNELAHESDFDVSNDTMLGEGEPSRGDETMGSGDVDMEPPAEDVPQPSSEEQLPQIATEASNINKEIESETNASNYHNTVTRYIKKIRSELTKSKNAKTNPRVVDQLLDLKACEAYNTFRYQNFLKVQALRKQLKAQWKGRELIRQQLQNIKPAIDASQSAAQKFGRGEAYSRDIRFDTNHIYRTGELPESTQGKGGSHKSLLSDPRVYTALQSFVKGGLNVKDGGFAENLHPSHVVRYANQFLFPSLAIQESISLSTATRWLKKLGFSMSRVQKGVYVDGHEREDVVQSRTKFIKYMDSQVFPFCYKFESPPDDAETRDLVKIPPILQPGQKIHYPLCHDEMTMHTNDLSTYVWMKDGQQPLRKKGRGRVIHVSDFIIEDCGRLCLTPEEVAKQMELPMHPSLVKAAEEAQLEALKGRRRKKPKKSKKDSKEGRSLVEHQPTSNAEPPLKYRLKSFDARRIIYPGANYDGWWDMPQLIAQTKDAIDIFDTKYPDGVAVFIFDCSSAHEAYASDALQAHKMNRNPGGQQPIMHDTINPMTGEVQKMVFGDGEGGVDKDNQPLAGKPKGMERILEERKLLEQLQRKHNGKAVGVCAHCKKSQAAREEALKEAREKRDEIEGSGLPTARDMEDVDEEGILLDADRPTDCCMQRVLSLQPDFMSEKPLLQIVIEQAGHKCVFLPKFHCELNPIELVWAQVKHYFRERADGTFPTAKKLAIESLNSVSTEKIRRCFSHCWRYLDHYRGGMDITKAEYAMKQFKSHRRIPGAGRVPAM